MAAIRKEAASAYLQAVKPPAQVELVLSPGRRIVYHFAIIDGEPVYRLFRTPPLTIAPEKLTLDKMRRSMEALAGGAALSAAF